MRIWDTATGTCLQVLEGHQSRVVQVIFSTDGKHMASASSDGTIRLWAPALGAKQIEGLNLTQLKNLTYLPGGANLGLIQDDEIAGLWDGHTFACQQKFETTIPFRSLTFGRDDGSLETDYEQFNTYINVPAEAASETSPRSTRSTVGGVDPFASFQFPKFRVPGNSEDHPT